MTRALVVADVSICICATNPEKNAAARAELEDFGADIHAFECNVGDHKQVESNIARDDCHYRELPTSS